MVRRAGLASRFVVDSHAEPVLHFNVDLWGLTGALPTRVHQRSIAIGRWEHENPQWGEWWRAAGRRGDCLSIFWDWSRGSRGRSMARLDVDPAGSAGPELVSLSVIDHPRNYDGLDAEAVTLTFVASLNALLGGVAARLDLARPEPIPPTRRERRWLDEGNQAPPPVADLTKPLTDRRKEVRPLPEAEFWAIVNALSGNGEQRERRLRGQLRKLTLAQLAGFQARYVWATRELYTSALWSVANDAIGWASDDAFTSLRCWAVGQGQSVFDGVRTDPNRLHEALAGADLEDVGDGEALATVADELYVDRCGRSIAADYLGIQPLEPDAAPA